MQILFAGINCRPPTLCYIIFGKLVFVNNTTHLRNVIFNFYISCLFFRRTNKKIARVAIAQADEEKHLSRRYEKKVHSGKILNL